MNRKMIFHTLGRLLQIEAGLLMLPLIVSLIYKESCALAFLITALVSLALGFLLVLLFKPKDTAIYAREGFVITAFAWILMSMVGALPFVISGEIPNYVNALFETISGFTTTGASILTDVESLSRGILFWRSFTHWIGGMGILVLIMAIFPTESGRTIHIMRAEMSGPEVGKIVPKISKTAKILYVMYISLTLLEVVFLLAGGMPLYDSIIHAVGTAGTGGFGIKGDSIGSYSPYLQWVITVFMLLFGVNFSMYYLILTGKVVQFLKNRELWFYMGIVIVAGTAVTINVLPLFDTVSDAIRTSAFQVASILTTTGFSSTDFNAWPYFSKTILLILMFLGGCAGSTAGGFKLSRILMLGKLVKRNLNKMIHPRSVKVVKAEGRKVDDETLDNVSSYLALFVATFLIIFILIAALEPVDFETSFSASIACLNNIGPGFGLVGPASNFAAFSVPSKLILSVAMLMGRLELLPVILAFYPKTWKKN